MKIRPTFSFFAAFLILAVAGHAADGRRDAGAITERITAQVTPVRIEADSPSLRQLAEQAYSVHGAFRVDPSASDVLRFSVAGSSAVNLTITSGRPGRVVYNQTFNGSSLRNALFRAADGGVLHLVRLPGFFAGKLTFVSEATGASEVFTSDLFFGEAIQQTNDRSQSVMPRWSPDGRAIVYTGYFQTGAPDIYMIDVVDKRRESFVSVKGTNNGARFSPDGSRVAMILSGSGNPEVYIANAQGSKQIMRITVTEKQIEATPTWSPDGRQLIVASDALATGKPQLYLLNAARGTTLSRIPTNISGYCAEPDWNHANRDLVAFTAATGNGFQIAVFSFAERKSRFVSRAPRDAIEPCWLSDGRHLLYTARTENTRAVCILDTETGRSTRLSPSSLGKTYQANFVLP